MNYRKIKMLAAMWFLFMSLFRKNNSLSVLLSEKLPEIERKCSSNQDLSRKDMCPKRLPWQKDVLRPEPGAVRAQGSGDRLTTARMLSQHLARPCSGRRDRRGGAVTISSSEPSCLGPNGPRGLWLCSLGKVP